MVADDSIEWPLVHNVLLRWDAFILLNCPAEKHKTKQKKQYEGWVPIISLMFNILKEFEMEKMLLCEHLKNK